MIIRSPFPDIELSEVPLHEFVLGQAERRGASPAVIDGTTGASLSYQELAAAVRRVAAGLQEQGVAKGDVLGLCGPNSPDFVVTYYAAASVGAVITTINPLATGHDMTAQLTDTGARWLVTTDEIFEDKGRQAAAEAGVRQTVVYGEADGAIPFARLSATVPSGPLPAVSPDDLMLLPYSSGTSGRPKGVMLTHRHLVTSVCQTAVPHQVRPDDVVAGVLPMYHIFGMQVTMNLALRSGATLVTIPRYSLETFLAVVQAYRVTRTELVPPIVLALAKQPEVDRYDLSSLRVLTCGAAPLGADLARTCARRLGCRVKQGYGMTELSGASHLAPDTGRNDYEWIAPGMPGIESRIVDLGTGADAPLGERGELLVRSPTVMLGYLNNPEATAATIDADGWVHTGDIAMADEQGWVKVVDRLKELIKYKGHQVAPAELESVLVTNPNVADCAVVPCPDPEAGEVPKAFVVLRPGCTSEGLLDWVAQRVAPYQKIRLLEVVDQIPKSPSGKILRRVLVERVRAQAGAASGTIATGMPSARSVRPLAGQVAMVTGASRGFGRVIAQVLSDAGAAVGLVARSADLLKQAVVELAEGGGTAVAAPADVSDVEAMKAATLQVTSQLGPVDVLVNNAGISGPMGPLWEVDPDQWWQAMEVNLRSVVTCCQLVLPAMVARRHGRIVNITSQSGAYRWPLVSSYAVSKAAQIKLTENLATELRGTGVTVFSLHPGLLPLGVSEPALTTRPPEGSAEATVYAWLRRQFAEGRGSEPETAARYVLRLAAGDADELSGCHLTVDDDLDVLTGQIDAIKSCDLYTLRRQGLANGGESPR